MKDLLSQFLGKELAVDELLAFQYLLDYNGRYDLLKIDRSLDVFKDLKSASELITVHSAGNYEITNFSKLNFNLPTDSIIELHLNGFMSSDDGLCSYGAKSFAKALLAYKNQDNVIGAVIHIDSGGGEGMAGHIIHGAIKEFGKPVVAYVLNAGSAAYLAASGAVEIVAANENTKVGSIGAYVSISKKFLEMYGAEIMEIYSDYSNEKNKEIRALLKGDDGPIKEMLNRSVEIFHDVVRKNRTLKKDPEGTLKGGMYFAKEAKQRGLIDHIGSHSFALSRVQEYRKMKKK